MPAREQSEAAWRAELSSVLFGELSQLTRVESTQDCRQYTVGTDIGGAREQPVVASEQLDKGQRKEQRKYEQRRRKRLYSTMAVLILPPYLAIY